MKAVAARDGPVGRVDSLVQRAALGDIAAFNSLVADRLDRCYRLAWSIIGNDADAADATQEAFVSAWRQLPNLRDAAAFDGWLNRIVANAARMGRRHRMRLREVQVIDAESDAERGAGGSRQRDSGVAEIDAVAESDAIGRAFARLRPEQRAILALHHVDERPIAEIATSLAIPQGTVKSRLYDARRALERAMEAEG